jgi:putative FmdB family regulatory protein
MPAYDYRCQSCQKEWVEIHGFDEKPEKCPYCQADNFKKVFKYQETVNKLTETMQNKTGKKTRDYIEQARNDLKEYKVENKR